MLKQQIGKTVLDDRERCFVIFGKKTPDGEVLRVIKCGWFGVLEAAVTKGTPAMFNKMVGVGSQYALVTLDADKNSFDGSKTYKMHLPPNVPAKTFWSVVLYDTQTRSELQTDQRFPSNGSQNPAVKKNADGSYDVYFGPKPPAGMEGNWVQTVPNKSFFAILRLYSPLEPYFDKSWQPDDIVVMK